MKRIFIVLAIIMLILNFSVLHISANEPALFPTNIAAKIFAIDAAPDPVVNNGSEFVHYENYVFYVKCAQLLRLNLDTKELLVLDDVRNSECFELDPKIFIYNGFIYYQTRSAEGGIYRIDIDGNNKTNVPYGLISYFDTTRGILFSHTFYGGNSTCVTFLNEDFRYDIEETHINILDTNDSYIVYSERNNNDDTTKIYCINHNSLNPVLVREHNTYMFSANDIWRYTHVTKAQIVDDFLFYNFALDRISENRYIASQLFKAKLDGSAVEVIEEVGASTFFIKDGQLYSGHADLGLGGAYRTSLLDGTRENANNQSIFGDFVFGDYQYLPYLTDGYYTTGSGIERFDFNTNYENKQTIVSMNESENLSRSVDKITVVDDWIYFTVKNTQYGWGYGSDGRYVGWQFYRVETDGAILELLEKDLEILVSVDGYYMPYDDFTVPFIEYNRVLIPFRRVFDALGASVDWDSDTRTVLAQKGDIKIALPIGSNIMRINGREVTLDAPAKIVNDRTFVPIRAISEAFGYSVEWDENNQTVVVTSK